MTFVTLHDVEAARRKLSGVVRLTPMEGSRVLSEMVGGKVVLKCENLQRTGSFKIRGAYTRISRLDDASRAAGVVAASAGNHAQGVALAASLLGMTSTVFMPVGAPLPKVAATSAYGADVQLVGRTLDETLQAALAFATENGRTFIHPFDHPDLIAGHGTVGLEILEQFPEARTVVVSVGGGGLVSGIAVAAKAIRPDVKVVGVQAAGAAVWPESLRQGRPVPLTSVQTIADGIAIAQPGVVTFDYLRDLVDGVVTVSEEAMSRAIVLCLERAKLVVEPAGVAALAAVYENPEAFEPPVVAVLSGGNIDPLLLGKVISHGLGAAGRQPALRLDVPDYPGALARLLELIADAGANVVDIEHHRMGGDRGLGDVEVTVQLETRGPQHSETVRAILADAGYGVRG